MIPESILTSAPAAPRPARRLAYRTAGQTHGPITRLMSPGDLGELVKPFVFLDHFASESFAGGGFPMHPHSGIATHTTLLQGSTTYRDSTGKSGRLDGESVEWMQAGGGVWHTGAPILGEAIRGFQLWVALPAALENAPAESHYIDAPTIPGEGPVRVLLGGYGGLRSPIPFGAPMTYLHVRLRDGEAWSFDPPAVRLRRVEASHLARRERHAQGGPAAVLLQRRRLRPQGLIAAGGGRRRRVARRQRGRPPSR